MLIAFQPAANLPQLPRKGNMCHKVAGVKGGNADLYLRGLPTIRIKHSTASLRVIRPGNDCPIRMPTVCRYMCGTSAKHTADASGRNYCPYCLDQMTPLLNEVDKTTIP